jgi:hypothetical protein
VGKSRRQIEVIIREDPFYERGLADFRIIEFERANARMTFKNGSAGDPSLLPCCSASAPKSPPAWIDATFAPASPSTSPYEPSHWD